MGQCKRNIRTGIGKTPFGHVKPRTLCPRYQNLSICRGEMAQSKGFLQQFPTGFFFGKNLNQWPRRQKIVRAMIRIGIRFVRGWIRLLQAVTNHGIRGIDTSGPIGGKSSNGRRSGHGPSHQMRIQHPHPRRQHATVRSTKDNHRTTATTILRPDAKDVMFNKIGKIGQGLVTRRVGKAVCHVGIGQRLAFVTMFYKNDLGMKLRCTFPYETGVIDVFFEWRFVSSVQKDRRLMEVVVVLDKPIVVTKPLTIKPRAVARQIKVI
eukprot:scaffold18052_cov175-Amphora_coffeaeformis.AAC.5